MKVSLLSHLHFCMCIEKVRFDGKESWPMVKVLDIRLASGKQPTWKSLEEDTKNHEYEGAKQGPNTQLLRASMRREGFSQDMIEAFFSGLALAGSGVLVVEEVNEASVD